MELYVKQNCPRCRIVKLAALINQAREPIIESTEIIYEESKDPRYQKLTEIFRDPDTGIVLTLAPKGCERLNKILVPDVWEPKSYKEIIRNMNKLEVEKWQDEKTYSAYQSQMVLSGISQRR